MTLEQKLADAKESLRLIDEGTIRRLVPADREWVREELLSLAWRLDRAATSARD